MNTMEETISKKSEENNEIRGGSYLETELIRQKKLLEHVKSLKDSTKEEIANLENNIKITEKTILRAKEIREQEGLINVLEVVNSVEDSKKAESNTENTKETPAPKVVPTPAMSEVAPQPITPTVTQTPEPAPTPTTSPATPDIAPTKTPEEFERALDEARAKYAEGYKKFLVDRRKNTATYNIGDEYATTYGEEKEKIPDELKELEKEYEKATVEYERILFKTEWLRLLEDKSLSKEQINAELSKYKQGKIFAKVVVEEGGKLNALKIENRPSKEKGIIKKGLDWYLKQPRGVKVGMSFLLSGGFAMFALPGSVAAAGGAAAYWSIKGARTLAGLGAGQGTAKLFDLVFKDKSAEEKEVANAKLAALFAEGNLSNDDIKKEYAEILEKEQSTKRKRLVWKAMASMVAGGAASIGVGYEMGQMYSSSGQLREAGGGSGADEKLRELHEKAVKGFEPPESKVATTPETPDSDIHHINENHLVHKGEGVENTFRRQIEHDGELAKNLGFKGDIADPKALHQFSGGAAHRLAIDKGYVDDTGEHQIGVIGANKVAFEVKLENGHPVVIEKTINGKILETLDKEKYEFGKSNNNPFEKEFNTPHEPVASVAETTPATPTPKSFHLVGEKPEGFGKLNAHLLETDPLTHPESAEITATRAKVMSQMNTSDNGPDAAWRNQTGPVPENHDYATEPEHSATIPRASKEDLATIATNSHQLALFKDNPFDLEAKDLMRTYSVHQHNIEHIFPENKISDWNKWSHLKAKDFLKIKVPENAPESANTKLVSYLHKLFEETNLKPTGGFLSKNETVEHWMAGALQQVAKDGNLDELKIE